MALAAKLPYDHPYAGGFPGIGSQPLPTDSDCLTYLAAVAAADGAGVEVGVATAVDTFFKALKAAGVFDALKACCILAGARTLAGALVPVVGDAPSNNNFVAADYARGGATPGLKGDASTKYLDSNRSADDDPQNDCHAAFYISAQATVGSEYLSNRDTNVTAPYVSVGTNLTDFFFRLNSTASGQIAGQHTGLVGMSRSGSASFVARVSGADNTVTAASGAPSASNVLVFDRQASAAKTDARLAFYSIGESLDLEALDDAVSALVTAIGAAV